MCYEYNRDMVIFNSIKAVILIIVISINVLIEYVTSYFVEKIGYRNQSYQIRENTKVIFLLKLINTGFARLISQANFINTPFDRSSDEDKTLSNGLGRGSFNDFSKNWYLVVGSEITDIMVTQAFLPYIELFLMMAVNMV